MKITRRSAIGILASSVALEQQVSAQTGTPGAVDVRWLDGSAPGAEIGVTWGVPWARGTVKREQTFALTADSGKALPVQSWPLAYWPDGSVKFSAFATVTNAPGPLRLAPGTPVPATAIKVAQSPQAIDIDTGKLQCRIPRSGSAFIGAMTIEGRVVARDARLVCTLEDRSTPGVLRFPEFTSEIKKVEVEQSGPVRAVVKIEGVHKGGAREWLPFVVRLYFYARRRAGAAGAHCHFRWRSREGFHQGTRPGLRGADARAGAQPAHPSLRRSRWIVVRTRAAIDWPTLPARKSVRRPACRKAHRQQGNLQRRRPEVDDRLGHLGRLQTHPDHGRWLHHSEAHQSRKLLARRHRGPPLERPCLRRRCLRWTRGRREELLAILSSRTRSSQSDFACRRLARVVMVARSARDGPAPLRHQSPQPGFQL